MLEVLVTIVILAFGMLGLAGLQSKIFTSEMESYQRAQAVVLANDMVERITANRTVDAKYVPTINLGCNPNCAPPPATSIGETTYGTATANVGDCVSKTTPTLPPGVLRDLCEWSNTLKGAAETSGASKVGGMVGALGCITQIQAKDETLGVCKPSIYMVSVAWQGLNATSIPSASCGQGSFGSDDRFRRVVSARVSIGTYKCY